MPKGVPSGWNVLNGRRTELVIKVLAHPLDRVIYEMLREGMLQQCQLFKALRNRAGISEGTLRFHLKRLAKVGLIDFVYEGKKKYARRAMDIRMLARALSKEVAKAPTPREEYEKRMRRIFRK